VPLLKLVKNKRADDPIFTREDGKRATRYWAYHHMLRICGLAKVPALSPQAFRRTASDVATDAGELGPVIAAHLGQESSVVTDRSYRDRTIVADARQERGFRIIAGGKR
jgi:integrase